MTRSIRTLALLVLLLPGRPLPAQAATTQAPAAQTPPAKGAETALPEATRLYDAAYTQLQKKAFAAALPLYEQALALAPERAEIWNEYGICLRQLRRFPASARAGWRAVQLDGGRTMQAWNALANTFMEAREWSAALTCLEKVEALHKDQGFVARNWLNLAFRRMAAGETEGIVDACRRATRLDPLNSLAWIDLGQALACAGAPPKEAADPLDKGVAMAEQQKDKPRADYARQLLKKVQAGESVWPPAVGHRSWQPLPTALLSLPGTDASQLALPALVEHRYALAGGGTLALSTPEPWAEAFDSDRPENQFTVTFTRPGTEGFKVFFSASKGTGNPAGVKATAEQIAKLLLPGSLEKELPLHDLASPTMQGFWLFSTDKKTAEKEPAPGDYRHLVSALMEVGGVPCVGTVLTNSKAAEVVEPCLAAFRSARRIEGMAKK